MLWFSKTIYTSDEGVSNDGSGRRPKNKSGPESSFKVPSPDPRAERTKKNFCPEVMRPLGELESGSGNGTVNKTTQVRISF